MCLEGSDDDLLTYLVLFHQNHEDLHLCDLIAHFLHRNNCPFCTLDTEDHTLDTDIYTSSFWDST